MATRTLSDAEARRAIREDLQVNLLVEAGAGSGKTHMLAERIAAGIASGDYRIEHLAAVTFTRKAASELRGRVHLALERRLAGLRGPAPAAAHVDRPDPEAAARLRGALGNLERLFAGTIHSFCARLLRERPVESGVSPGFTELDEVQDEELRNRSWREFIAHMRAEGDPDMLALLDTGLRPADLESAFAVICGNDDVAFAPGEGACPEVQPARAALEAFWKRLEGLLPSSIDDGTTCEMQKASRQFEAQMRVARRKLDRPAMLASLLETWDCRSTIVQKWWPGTSAETKRLKLEIEMLHGDFCAQTVTPFLTAWRQYVYRLSVILLTRARAFASGERRRRNALNYGDLLNLAAKVLRENGQVRAALQQKYEHLFVVEFQDTDPVQAEIVFLLAADEAHELVADAAPAAAEHIADWRTVRVRPGAIFVVGDPKQSIYRFRRADIEIYNAVRERLSEQAVGRVVALTTNFRSVPELCEWANGVFAGLFPPEPTQHSPRFASLDPHEDAPELTGRGETGLHALQHRCEDANAVLEADAAAIAGYIRAEVEAGRRRYSDFLILTRKKRDRIAPYAAALEAMAVPVEVSGAGAFGESAEVAALTVLLRALADPQDQLTLVNVLRGPLFGVSDPELFDYKQQGGWFSLFAGDGEASRPASAVARALKDLHQYFRWTRMLPAGAALERILERSGYLALAATSPAGVEAGDLLHAIDRVRRVVEDGGSLADAADALEADSEASNEVESLPLEPGRSDVVRLMNLHKGKGLEADVVFLADPCGGMRRRVDVHIRREGAQALGWFKVEKKSEGSFAARLLGQHADWEQHKAAEEPFLAAEENRLLYVAATRARKMLVVSAWSQQKGTQAWGALNTALGTAKPLVVPASVTVEIPRPQPCSADMQASAAEARAKAHARIKLPSWSITSATADHVATKTAARVPTTADDPTRVVAQDTAGHRADAGMAWGTLIHGLLEHAMRFPDASPEDLRRLAMWLTVEEPQLRAVIDDAIATVKHVARAEFWVEAQAGEHYEEAPFATAHTGVLTTGVIDLLFQSRGAWQVRDYKTDLALESEQYAAQLATYRSVLRALGYDEVEAALVPVRRGEGDS